MWPTDLYSVVDLALDSKYVWHAWCRMYESMQIDFKHNFSKRKHDCLVLHKIKRQKMYYFLTIYVQVWQLFKKTIPVLFVEFYDFTETYEIS